MVNKSKLKMALVAEKQTDFKQEHQKKMVKKARKEKKAKQPVAPVVDDEEAEDDDEEEDEEGIRELMELDEKENGDEYRRTEVNSSMQLQR
jgi:rRNA-processing protein EBP2